MDKMKKVPEIRFKEFEEEWVQSKLGDCFLERVERSAIGELISVTINNGVVKAADTGRADSSSADKSNYKRVEVGDIAYNSMRMWQGVSAYSDYEGIVSPAYTILKPKGRVNAKFFAYLFKMPEVVFLFYRFSQGLVDDTRNLKYQNFKRISVSYPASAEEQTAIVSILETADKEIDLLTQEIEQEKQKKKALMQLLLTGIARV